MNNFNNTIVVYHLVFKEPFKAIIKTDVLSVMQTDDPLHLSKEAHTLYMENTAKNFALQLGSLIALYVSIGALIGLLFGIITTKYPDTALGYYELESAASTIRYTIAILIVFFPTYIILTRLVNTIRRMEHGMYLTLTKWLIYISLLIGGGVLLGDLVTVLNGFLNGELTIRFILKALSVLVVVGMAFSYYVLDARGYWQSNEKQSIQYAMGVGALVLVVLVLGFMNTKTPNEVREMRIDSKQINNLQNIQSRIEEYYFVKAQLPETLNQAFLGNEAPVASDGRTAYAYKKTSATSFELCAEFAFASSKSEQAQYAVPMYTDQRVIKNPYNWEHKEGTQCFERIVSPIGQPAQEVQKLGV